MKITFLRHTEVKKEYIGCYNGHIDIPLSQKGLEDAKVLKNKLDAQKFDKIFCSDLLRAKETLRAFCAREDVVFTPLLREKSWGEDEGKSYDEICKSKKIEYKEFYEWAEQLGGESLEEFVKRVESFLTNLKNIPTESNILIVTHGGVIKAAMSILKSIPLQEAFSTPLKYGALMKYDTIKNRMEIL